MVFLLSFFYDFFFLLCFLLFLIFASLEILMGTGYSCFLFLYLTILDCTPPLFGWLSRARFEEEFFLSYRERKIRRFKLRTSLRLFFPPLDKQHFFKFTKWGEVDKSSFTFGRESQNFHQKN